MGSLSGRLPASPPAPNSGRAHQRAPLSQRDASQEPQTFSALGPVHTGGA